MKKCIFILSVCVMALHAESVFSDEQVTTQHNTIVSGDSIVPYDEYDKEFTADTMPLKEKITINAQQPILIVENDTINLGKLKRSDTPLVQHIPLKCNSQSDVRITAISVSNSRARVSASPIITAGTKGTIICIVDKKSMPLGTHVDAISIKTDNASMPEKVIYIKYEIEANH